MASWNSTTPYRTGVPTLLKLCRVICRLLAAFSPIIKEHLSEDAHVFVDALNVACAEFVDNVPAPTQ